MRPAKAHVYCGGILCGDRSATSMAGADTLCQRCQARVERFITALTKIAQLETVGAVRCYQCEEVEGRHLASCPREIAAKALGYKNLADMLERTTQQRFEEAYEKVKAERAAEGKGMA